MSEVQEDSNLIAHAKRELEIIGEEPDFVEMYLNVVRAFVAFGHSGGSASVAITVIGRLLSFQNLSDLTDDPNEWMYHGPETWGDKAGKGVWQNIRNGEAFSNDGGKTYTLLSEREKNSKAEETIHTSKKHTS